MLIHLYFRRIVFIHIFFLPYRVISQQVADNNFYFEVSDPKYETGAGPSILFDEGHNNGSTIQGNFAPFARLLASEGFNVISSRKNISCRLLKDVKIYVTVNAMYDLENWNLPARSAFSRAEIDQLRNWVASGGSLLLITDHMPCGGSVSELAGEFGINVLNGFAIRKDGQAEIFTKEKKTLRSNAITSPIGKEVDSIMCWGGTGFLVPPNTSIISELGEDYRIYLPSNVVEIKKRIADTIPFISGRGIANGAYLRFGKGKVVIFGDAATFTAQLQGIKSEKRGMNHPQARQNVQFIRNIINWLDEKDASN